MPSKNIPLFPLHTVLFPGGPLQLKVFEPRYTDMISQCMKTNSQFGISLIREGKEIGEPASTYEIGTMAEITDWTMRDDGILGVSVVGGHRFKINDQASQSNNLVMADIEYFDEEIESEVPDDFQPLVDLLHDCMEQYKDRYAGLPIEYNNSSWVGYRLAEFLPLRLPQKQYFLQLNNPLQRLERLGDVLEHLNIHY
ncbi:MAG: LON peptidase substrate-binding domain-containing protein [Gammaproteobacteria bacterium]|nr:LON peptidase substrate-binding domain-containing protein [Gammaproteobacteria bacterium]MDH5727543.1 LON peptidase substrate-binding domain-containing protein [Gammaproteobacteria bacterium]